MFMRFFLFICALPFFIGMTSVFAQTIPPETLGRFGQWEAYHFQENGQPVCYMITSKTFANTKKFKRRTAYLMVTHRPQENMTDVVNYSPGYILAPKHDVKMVFGTTSYSLFADKDSAWARSQHMDHLLVAAMRNAKNVAIVGVPMAKAIPTQKDILTLTGAASAYLAISKACGLNGTSPPKITQKPRKKAS